MGGGAFQCQYAFFFSPIHCSRTASMSVSLLSPGFGQDMFFKTPCRDGHGGFACNMNEKHHAQLPAQVPASSVSENPGGNNRQETIGS